MRSALIMTLLSISFYAAADTLFEAVQYGMIANPDILLNTAKGLSAKQGVQKAKGAYYPSVDVNASFGRQRSKNPPRRPLTIPMLLFSILLNL